MRREQGFTLVELLVAMVVGSIAIASAYASYDVIAKQYEKVKGVTAMQSSSRSIMRMIERDIRMAGFKWRDSKGTITYGSISEPIKITDSGNKCCDAVTVTYDYRDEASKKVERHKIHYTVSPYQGRNRLYRKRDILFPKARAGNNDVLADYVEDLQIGDPDASSSSSNYTKLDKDGKELPDSAKTWSCVKDKKTGLIWEAKTTDSSEHDRTNEFDWYDSDPSTNGGYAGFNSKNTRSGLSRNTEQFVINVNNEKLCSYSQWSLPTVNQLLTLYSKKYASSPYNFNIRINKNYFPLVQRAQGYWSSTQAAHQMFVRHLNFDSGNSGGTHKSSGIYAMLVGSGQQQATRLIMIDLILRTKKEFGPARSYTKKSYAEGNYNINKNDAYKRQEYSSTVLIRNPL